MKSLFRSPKNKLSNQLLIGFGISLAVIGLTALSVTYAYLRANLEEQVKQRAMSITQGLEFASEGLIEDKEAFLLDRIVQNYSTLPTVLEISIVDPDGLVIAHSHVIDIRETGTTTYASIHPHFAASLQQASHKGTAVNLRTVLHGKPVFVQFLPFSSTLFKRLSKTSSELNQYRGVAIAILDLQQIERDALQNALLSILVMAISMGLILVFMGWLIRKLVLAPLAKIHLAIKDSEQRENFDLPQLPPNEIGFLGATFASVFEQLKDYKQMELIRAERKYEEAVQRYELATSAAKVWVWDWDIQADQFVFEQGIQHWLGYVNQDLSSPCQFQSWLDYVHSSDREAFTTALQNHLEGKVAEFTCEHRLIDVHGQPHWFLSRGQAVLDENARAIRAIGTITDIAERKQAEIVIQQQAQRESILLAITQRIRQSLDLKTIFEIVVKETRLFLNADRVGIFQFYPSAQFNDGEFVAESVLPPFNSAIAIKVHDYCFGEKYALGYQNGKIQSVDDIYQAGLTDCHIQILSQFQVKANLVVPLINLNGLWGLLCIHQCEAPRIWQEVEIDLVQQIANQLTIAIQQATLVERLQKELAERQQAEMKLTESNQKLAISNDELLRATRMKDEFLANMSHELRTPLNSILGLNEALQEQIFGTLNERQSKTLRTIEGSATHLLALINDILDVAKIESGQVNLDLASTSIENLCQSSLAFIKQQALTKRIQVIHQLPKYLPDLMLDERRMRQVLINLLNNAVKFTPEGGTITLEVSHVKESGNSYLRFAVIDTGIGISAENIQKLFQPFIQIDSALNRQYVGTGLGLALVKRIVELHGGKVGLTSELGLGSRFSVEIPFNEAEPKEEESPTTETVTSNAVLERPPEGESPLILIGDDNKANIITFSGYLEAKGYRMILAKDGKEVIDLAKQYQPDLIVMDIQMPIMDGLEASKRIRLDPQLAHIPIIALTALAMSGDREKCLESGANEYLAKPIRLKQLDQTIRQLLNTM